MIDLTIYERIEEENINLLSDMMITPKGDIYEYSLASITSLLENDFKIDRVELTEDTSVEYEKFSGNIEINQHSYYIEIILDKFEDSGYYEYISDMSAIYNINQMDVEAIKEANGNIVLLMEFNEDPRISYLDQLYLLKILSKKTGILVYDNSASKPLTMNQVNLLLETHTLPAFSILYSIHYISDKDTHTAWLHSHGLHRCGMIELEIINISNSINEFHMILQATIDYYLEKGMAKRGEKILVAQLPNKYIHVEWKPWEVALEELNKPGLFKKAPKFMGNKKDRDGHDHPSGVLYFNNEDKLVELNTWEKELEGNLMIMVSDEETLRMSEFASERFKHFKFIYSRHQNDDQFYFLIKAGIEVEGENKIGSSHEHMWFEVKEVTENDFVGKLINQPYNVASMEEGETYTISLENLTDYRIYRKEKVALDADNIYTYYDEYMVN